MDKGGRILRHVGGVKDNNLCRRDISVLGRQPNVSSIAFCFPTVSILHQFLISNNHAWVTAWDKPHPLWYHYCTQLCDSSYIRGGIYEARVSICPVAIWRTQAKAYCFQNYKVGSRPRRFCFTHGTAGVRRW